MRKSLLLKGKKLLFQQISVDLPKHATTLIDCLEHFTHPECLGSDTKLFCSKCKSHQEKTKQLSLMHVPIVICFHLKRFEHGLTSNKITTPVSFPNCLNISSFLSSTLKNNHSKNIKQKEIEKENYLLGKHLASFNNRSFFISTHYFFYAN